MPYVDEYGRIIPDNAGARPPPPGGFQFSPDPEQTQPTSLQPRSNVSVRKQPTSPVPPQRGGAPPAARGYDPNMVSTEDTSDQLSPTSLVLNYLKSKGITPTAGNIKAAINANALNPGQFGPFQISDPSPGGTQLRNAGVEDSNPARAITRALQPTRWDLTEPDARWDVPQHPPGLSDNRPIIGSKTMPGPGPGTDMELPKVPLPTLPPDEGALVRSGGPSEMPPPTRANAVALPEPSINPMETAMQRAIGGPPQVPQLPAPPEVPRLPAPAPQLALPAPDVPVRPQIAPVPEVPALPAPTPGLGGFDNAPQGEPGGRVRVGNVTPKAAPGKPVQGYPIEQTPFSRGVGGAATGAAAGAAGKGPIPGLRGVPGAVAGGVAGAAGPLIDAYGPSVKEIVPYIMRNLHLR